MLLVRHYVRAIAYILVRAIAYILTNQNAYSYKHVYLACSYL